MRHLTRLLALALVLLAGSGFYWVDTLRRGTAVPTETGPKHEPDYYFSDFTVTNFRHTGTPSQILEGERLTHYADDDTAEVRAPALTYQPVDGAPWHASARRGHVDQNRNRIDLIQDVVLRRQPASQPPVTLRTSRLTVLTEAGRARTERPVDVQGPGWRVQATGMTAYLEREKVELDHDVRGTYEPD